MYQLGDFITFANFYLPRRLPFHFFNLLFNSLTTLLPLFRLDRFQLENGRRKVETGWIRGIKKLLSHSFNRGRELYASDEAVHGVTDERQQRVISEVENMYTSLWDEEPGDMHLHNNGLDLPSNPFALPPDLQTTLLVTNITQCTFCPGTVPLTKAKEFREIHLINRAYRKVPGILAIATCRLCKADFYPDRVTFLTASSGQEPRLRRQNFINDTEYLQISKPGSLWVHRSIAVAQAQSILQRSSILGFQKWFNASYGGPESYHPSLTHRQSQRLFVEHMVRTISSAQEDDEPLSTSAHPNIKTIVTEACRALVKDGVLPGALDHTCDECTHPKRYRKEPEEGDTPGNPFAVADFDEPDVGAAERFPVV
jgi:hypothetical protein